MRRPSPSMIVSIIAVVMASAGTSVAAVTFVKNAGAVDGKSAVSASATNAKAAGKLVATGKSGKLPIKFLGLEGIMRGDKQTFAVGLDVPDNTTGQGQLLGGRDGLGLISATCGSSTPAALLWSAHVAVTRPTPG